MDLSSFRLIRLSDDHNILPFDCGDTDLSDFIINDSKDYLKKLLAVTYLLEHGGITAAFFCVSNDRIAIEDMDSKSQFYKWIMNKMPDGKKYKSYPAVKIGRMAVDSSMQGQRLGTILLDYIKEFFITNNKTGCMFITVDAYSQSLKFYEQNGFKYLCPAKDKEKNVTTRLMYYDLRELTV